MEKTDPHAFELYRSKKKKISCDFQVFLLSPIPKNENLEIKEILQKRHNTEI